MGKLIDLTGQKFGTLTVIERDTTKKDAVYWKCKCDCGRERTVLGATLREGKATSCGHYPCKNACRRLDLTGKQFGRWTVKEYKGRNQFDHTIWLCECECGNTGIVETSSLTTGHSRSCGCLQQDVIAQRNRKEIPIGTKFGELTVIENLHYTIRGGDAYRCRCSCGQIRDIPSTWLRSGNTASCGCLLSKGERIIANFFTQHNIVFIPQWNNNKQMRLTSGHVCRFDFAVFAAKEEAIPLFCLEYNGIQHYNPNCNWGNENNFQATQQRDAEKAKLCEEAGIPLEIIPYTDFNNLEEILTKLLQKYNLYKD